MNTIKIGEIIKKQRKEVGITQIELANKADISTSYLCDIEKGRSVPSIVTLKKIAKALEIKDFNIFLSNSYVNTEIEVAIS